MKHLTTCGSRKLDLMSYEILSILKLQFKNIVLTFPKTPVCQYN